MDINTKILKKNAFRVTRQRGMTASKIRVPGGHLDAKYLSQIQHIAETFRKWHSSYYQPAGI